MKERLVKAPSFLFTKSGLGKKKNNGRKKKGYKEKNNKGEGGKDGN